MAAAFSSLQKYKKLKFEYRQGLNNRNATGNSGNEDHSEHWGTLTSAFVGRVGVSGAILADTDDKTELQDDTASFSASTSAKTKAGDPINELASAMKHGMTAIAASFVSDDSLLSLVRDLQDNLKKTQFVNQQIQSQQLALLQSLVAKMSKA